MHGIWAQDKSISIKVYSVYLKETLIQRKIQRVSRGYVSSFTEEFPQSAVSLDSALLSSHHLQEERGKGRPRTEVGGQGWPSSGGKPDMLMQEIPPGQECLSSLEDLGLYHHKGLLLLGSSHEKTETSFIYLAIKN